MRKPSHPSHTWKVAALAAAFLSFPALTAVPLRAQEPAAAPQERPGVVRVDSIALEGNRRVSRETILNQISIQPGAATTYREIQRAEKSLWSSGQFSDVQVRAMGQPTAAGGERVTLIFQLEERPLVRQVRIRGLEHASEKQVRDSASLVANAPYSPQAVMRASDFIRERLSKEGIPFARIDESQQPVSGLENVVDVILDVSEGNRVSIAQVDIRGNEAVSEGEIRAAMSTKPEGFWWFRPGSYDPERYSTDLQSAIPDVYSSRGYLDFRILSDTVIVDPETGKARIEIDVDEGPSYRVSELTIEGNQYFTDDRIESFFQVESGGLLSTLGLGGEQTSGDITGRTFNEVAFRNAVDQIGALYRNEGYIFARVEPLIERVETLPGEDPQVRVGVQILEGSPATVNRIAIEGNDYTHEWVIRDKLFLLPGDVYSQDRLLQSWQSIGSLGFFETPLPVPDVVPNEDTGLVDITFHVKEKQTGAINFGTSVGGGYGVAGFIGYDQPNLFGQAKEAHLRWDFGRYLQNFSLTLTDPALFQSRVSGSIALFNSTDRFIQFQSGRRQRIGGTVRFGFPLPNDPRTRFFTGYSLSRTEFRLREGAEDISLFGQPDGVQSQLQLGLTRSTVDHPLFPTSGSRLSWNVDLNGGIFGGDGTFSKHMLEGTFWVPVAQVGGTSGGQPIRFALGLSAKAGAIFGDASRFPFDQFWMGGVQFGQPLRGYDETSITPLGYFPENTTGISDLNRLGKAFLTLNAEYDVRLNDMVSIGTFFDAGNVWRSPQEIDPSRLFRGAGFGLQLVTPFGPIGIDYAYGFDKTVPGWQLHFRMGPGGT